MITHVAHGLLCRRRAGRAPQWLTRRVREVAMMPLRTGAAGARADGWMKTSVLAGYAREKTEDERTEVGRRRRRCRPSKLNKCRTDSRKVLRWPQ